MTGTPTAGGPIVNGTTPGGPIVNGPVIGSSTMKTAYPMDNRNRYSASHHNALADLLDQDTCERLAVLDGNNQWAGKTCLEVGAGAGSIALRLAEAVGPAGAVVATDREVDQIPRHPRLAIVEHDLCGDAPLPAGPYHLIHARLVLSHLPTREKILDRLIDLLHPGGTILLEDWAPLRTRDEVIVSAPSTGDAVLYGKYQKIVGSKVFGLAGTDPDWARRMHTALLARGLTDVDTTLRARYWTGGDAGTRLVAAVLAQVRPQLLRAGLTGAELNTMLMLLADPRLVVHGHPMYATSGRRSA